MTEWMVRAKFYPLSTAWLASMTLLALVAGDTLDLTPALVIETVMILTLMFISLNRQLRIVHKLINSQRTELLAFNRTLIDSLKAAGLPVPDEPTSGHRAEARQEQRDRES